MRKYNWLLIWILIANFVVWGGILWRAASYG